MIKVSYTLKELHVTDSLFLKNIDSLILQTNCPSIKEGTNKYFLLLLKKSRDFDPCYIIHVELYKYPFVEYSDLGYFYYKGYIFIVRGDEIESIFKRKKSNRTFSYMKGEIPIIVDPPLWLFVYNYPIRKWILIENDCY